MNIEAMPMAWYNFRTSEYEYHAGVPDNKKDFISQHPSAQSLYDLYVDNDLKTPEEAMIAVLEACVGRESE